MTHDSPGELFTVVCPSGTETVADHGGGAATTTRAMGKGAAWLVGRHQLSSDLANRKSCPVPGPWVLSATAGVPGARWRSRTAPAPPVDWSASQSCRFPPSSLAARLNRSRPIFEKQNRDVKPCLHHHDILHNSITKRPSHRKISPSHSEATRKYGGRAKKAARYVPPLHNPPPPHDTP